MDTLSGGASLPRDASRLARLPLQKTLRFRGTPLTGPPCDVDVESLRLTHRACTAFLDAHPGRADVEGDLLDTFEDILDSGIYHENDRGFHVYRSQGYEVVLSPDRRAVVGYRTVRTVVLSDLRSEAMRPPSLRRTFKLVGSPLSGPAADVDVDALDVSARAVESFRRRHAGTEEEADDGVRDTLEELIACGLHYETERGYHLYMAQGYQVTLDPTRRVVVGYDTAHSERTLTDLRDGVKSKRRRPPVAPAEVPRRLKPKSLAMVHAVWESHEGTFSSPAALRCALRAAVEEGKSSGSVFTDEDGTHVVSGAGWRVRYSPNLQWIVGADRI